jgi:hypothetical protein
MPTEALKERLRRLPLVKHLVLILVGFSLHQTVPQDRQRGVAAQAEGAALVQIKICANLLKAQLAALELI